MLPAYEYGRDEGVAEIYDRGIHMNNVRKKENPSMPRSRLSRVPHNRRTTMILSAHAFAKIRGVAHKQLLGFPRTRIAIMGREVVCLFPNLFCGV